MSQNSIEFLDNQGNKYLLSYNESQDLIVSAYREDTLIVIAEPSYYFKHINIHNNLSKITDKRVHSLLITQALVNVIYDLNFKLEGLLQKTILVNNTELVFEFIKNKFNLDTEKMFYKYPYEFIEKPLYEKNYRTLFYTIRISMYKGLLVLQDNIKKQFIPYAPLVAESFYLSVSSGLYKTQLHTDKNKLEKVRKDICNYFKRFVHMQEACAKEEQADNDYGIIFGPTGIEHRNALAEAEWMHGM